MQSDTFTCPACRAGLRRSPALGPGDTVMCPRCMHSFPYPDPEATRASLSPRAPSPATTAYAEEPASEPVAVEEDEDHPPRDVAIAFDLLEDRPLSTSEWFAFAREHWSSVVGPHAGFCLFYVLVVLVLIVPCIGIIVAFFLVPLLHAGLSVVAMAQLKGREWAFDDFFGAGPHAAAVLALAFCTLLLSLLLIPAVLALGHFLEALSGSPVFPKGGPMVLPAGLVSTPLFVLLHVRLFTFALPLVLERNFTAADALEMSWRLTRGRFWPLLRLHLLLRLLNVAGVLCFGVGLLATLPFTALVWNAAYLQLAGVEPPRSPAGPLRAEEQRYDAF
jgi:hypothetical protein